MNKNNPKNKYQLVLPSHIRNSLEFIDRIKKQLDLVIHIVDSRSKEISSTLNIEKIFHNKKILTIYAKTDLSDEQNLENSFNLKNPDSRPKILKLIKTALTENSKYNSSTYSPCWQVVVVGIPNVGKSTLINLLKKSQSSKRQNSPGTTKQISKFYIGDNIWLYDSPGIILPNLNKEANIKKLFLLNSLPIKDPNNFLYLEKTYNYLQEHYPNKLAYFGDNLPKDYQEFLAHIAKKYNLLGRNATLQLDQAEQKFLLFIHSGKIGKISWDKYWTE